MSVNPSGVSSWACMTPSEPSPSWPNSPKVLIVRSPPEHLLVEGHRLAGGAVEVQVGVEPCCHGRLSSGRWLLSRAGGRPRQPTLRRGADTVTGAAVKCTVDRVSPPPLPRIRAARTIERMTTVHEAAGGDAGLLALARAWHERCLADPVMSHPFSHPGCTRSTSSGWPPTGREALGGPTTFTDTMGDEPPCCGCTPATASTATWTGGRSRASTPRSTTSASPRSRCARCCTTTSPGRPTGWACTPTHPDTVARRRAAAALGLGRTRRR